MLNIFLFDPDPMLREAIGRIFEGKWFEGERCRVVAAGDFLEAVDAVTSETFDLIVCDDWVEEMDGLSFFRIIRDRQRKAVKVLMTGSPIRATSAEFRMAGVDYVMHKSPVPEFMKCLWNTHTGASQAQWTGISH